MCSVTCLGHTTCSTWSMLNLDMLFPLNQNSSQIGGPEIRGTVALGGFNSTSHHLSCPAPHDHFPWNKTYLELTLKCWYIRIEPHCGSTPTWSVRKPGVLGKRTDKRTCSTSQRIWAASTNCANREKFGSCKVRFWERLDLLLGWINKYAYANFFSLSLRQNAHCLPIWHCKFAQCMGESLPTRPKTCWVS